jgi:hypothetical protein
MVIALDEFATDRVDTGVYIDEEARGLDLPRGLTVIHATLPKPTPGSHLHDRIGQRRQVRVPARLMWRDASGTLRFASVMTRDVSDVDVFVECEAPTSIPMYRLVHFQIERPARDSAELPAALRHGKVLSAVYRVGPYRSATGTPNGYALRLLVEPARSGVRRPRSEQKTSTN